MEGREHQKTVEVHGAGNEVQSAIWSVSERVDSDDVDAKQLRGAMRGSEQMVLPSINLNFKRGSAAVHFRAKRDAGNNWFTASLSAEFGPFSAREVPSHPRNLACFPRVRDHGFKDTI